MCNIKPARLLYGVAALLAAASATQATPLFWHQGSDAAASSDSSVAPAAAVAAQPAVLTPSSAAPAAAAAATVTASSSNPTSSAVSAPATHVGVSPLGSASDVFKAGSACRAAWIPDTSGADTWKSMTIDLMTGSNLQMVKLGTVASNVDGTSITSTSYNYSCPQVTPNSAIYFLQYTHDNGQDATWTTRFAIASANGSVVPPPNANQPQGGSPAIPWGAGQLMTSGTTTNATASSSSATANPSAAAKGSSAQQQAQLASAMSSIFGGNSGSSQNSKLLQMDGALSLVAPKMAGWTGAGMALAAIGMMAVV